MAGESASGKAIATVKYTHDGIIDALIANPEVSQGELAKQFGYTQAWVSRVIRSDAFRERLAARKSELVDPMILQAVEQRFEILVEQSLEILQAQLAMNPSFDKALKVADLGSRALGYGAKSGPVINNTANFVVAMPEKAKTGEEWLARRLAGGAPIDAEPVA